MGFNHWHVLKSPFWYMQSFWIWVCAFLGSLPYPSASLACVPSHPQRVCSHCQGWRWSKYLTSPSADLFICFLCETPWLSKQAPNPFVSCQRPLESSSDSLVASTRPSAWRVGTDVHSVVTCAVWTTLLRISSLWKSSKLFEYPKVMSLNTCLLYASSVKPASFPCDVFLLTSA